MNFRAHLSLMSLETRETPTGITPIDPVTTTTTSTTTTIIAVATSTTSGTTTTNPLLTTNGVYNVPVVR